MCNKHIIIWVQPPAQFYTSRITSLPSGSLRGYSKLKNISNKYSWISEDKYYCMRKLFNFFQYLRVLFTLKREIKKSMPNPQDNSKQHY